MEINKLNTETRELIANSIEIYHAIKSKNDLYNQEGVAALSLYAGVLRMKRTTIIRHVLPSMSGPGAGYPYPQGIRPSTRGKKVQNVNVEYNYENIVCQILNDYGITIENVLELLGLEKRLQNSVSASQNPKLEKQYNECYKLLLQTIKRYYTESARILNNGTCKPLVQLTIPTIISALHYPNIDSTSSINRLYSKLINSSLPSSPDMPEYLSEIEKHVVYEEELCRVNDKNQLELYKVSKPLVMNKTIGRIIL